MSHLLGPWFNKALSKLNNQFVMWGLLGEGTPHRVYSSKFSLALSSYFEMEDRGTSHCVA